MRQPQSQISLLFFFFYYTKEGKKSVNKTVSSNLFPGTEVFIAGKIHPHPTYTPRYPHTPDKTPKNYLSRKSLFQAEGQGSFKDALGFIFISFIPFSLGLCLAAVGTLATGSLRQAVTASARGTHHPSSLPLTPQSPSASGRVKESNGLETHSQILCIVGDGAAHGPVRGQGQGARGCSNKS